MFRLASSRKPTSLDAFFPGVDESGRHSDLTIFELQSFTISYFIEGQENLGAIISPTFHHHVDEVGVKVFVTEVFSKVEYIKNFVEKEIVFVIGCVVNYHFLTSIPQRFPRLHHRLHACQSGFFA